MRSPRGQAAHRRWQRAERRRHRRPRCWQSPTQEWLLAACHLGRSARRRIRSTCSCPEARRFPRGAACPPRHVQIAACTPTWIEIERRTSMATTSARMQMRQHQAATTALPSGPTCTAKCLAMQARQWSYSTAIFRQRWQLSPLLRWTNSVDGIAAPKRIVDGRLRDSTQVRSLSLLVQTI